MRLQICLIHDCYHLKSVVYCLSSINEYFITRSHDSGEQSYKACGQISLKRDFSKFRHTGTIYPEAMKNGKSY